MKKPPGNPCGQEVESNHKELCDILYILSPSWPTPGTFFAKTTTQQSRRNLTLCEVAFKPHRRNTRRHAYFITHLTLFKIKNFVRHTVAKRYLVVSTVTTRSRIKCGMTTFFVSAQYRGMTTKKRRVRAVFTDTDHYTLHPHWHKDEQRVRVFVCGLDNCRRKWVLHFHLEFFTFDLARNIHQKLYIKRHRERCIAIIFDI